MKFPEKIAIASDHAGFELKEKIRQYLEKKHVEVADFGTYGPESVDYPDFAHAVTKSIHAGEYAFGILICGTANGIAMAANKQQDIRAAIAWRKDIAELARTHNDANVLCLPARFIGTDLALECVEVFFTTDFEGGRHARRVDKINVC